MDASSRGHHSPGRASNESKHIPTVERETPESGAVSRDFGKNLGDGRWRRLSDCQTNPLSRREAAKIGDMRYTERHSILCSHSFVYADYYGQRG